MWSVCLRVSACGSPWKPASGWGDEPCRDMLLGSLWLRPRTLARRRPELSVEEAPRFPLRVGFRRSSEKGPLWLPVLLLRLLYAYALPLSSEE